MKPGTSPNDNAAQATKDKLAELEFEFPPTGAPDDPSEDIGKPTDLPEAPSAPDFPALSLPEQAEAGIDMSAANLPDDIFAL
ncbi:hypothetical protein ACW9UR_07805 [Halovulum sp. GXIMD14794]